MSTNHEIPANSESPLGAPSARPARVLQLHAACQLLSEEQAGSSVVIVDDTCTTGDSTIKAIVAAREAGLVVLGAAGLVDREEGAREAIEGGLGCPFDRIFRIAEL